jgi:hypothetical protein
LTGPLPPIPRTPYATAIGAAGLLSIVLGTGIAASAGGDWGVQSAVATVLVMGALLAALPLVGPPLVTPERWGMIVLGVSAARTFLAAGAMLILLEVQGLDRRPVVYGVLSGTLLMMMLEAAAAVWMLTRRERLRHPSVHNGSTS